MVKKSKDSKFPMTFSCRQCGHPYQVYPPDISFEEIYMSPCQESSDEPNHNFEQIFECLDCHSRENKLYWCQGHIFIAVESEGESRRWTHRSDFDRF